MSSILYRAHFFLYNAKNGWEKAAKHYKPRLRIRDFTISIF